jgi:RHH-type proline utilization regulon transcriptional repressor/proline dehydrogenase/delta 1-pyrroline-5-carboxylate dehydrogenase
VTRTIRAGNVYVNRNMVEPWWGSQPFGGEGLSGTGPKAGGPFYLHRLVRNSDPPGRGSQACVEAQSELSRSGARR